LVEALRALLFTKSLGIDIPRWQIRHLLWMLMNVELRGDQYIFQYKEQ
jgi:hypothetical protein